MRELFRGAVFLHILHHAAEGPIHGAWMSAELSHHGYDISAGTLYPTLHRMEADGLLASTKETIDGRVLRVYRATGAGVEALADGRRAVRELAAEVLPPGPSNLPKDGDDL
ncbi:MAG: helix-turn-helix transcriptional regulator [Microbacteriaceae bacterium]|nr:helix-turn-helix transcriptional regulator [Microbacteriaceae bacterium]